MSAFPPVTLNKNQRLLISIFSLILFLIWLATFGITLAPQPPREQTLYTYTLNADSAYSVSLLPNDIYSQSTLGENAVYTTNLMKDLSVSFSASYQGSQAAATTCTYAVKAQVRGYQTIGGTQADVFTKDYQIQAPKTVRQENTSTFDIAQNLTIDPAVYNDFSAKAQKQISSSLNREVQIIFSGTFETATANGAVTTPFSSAGTMPLGSELFVISKTTPYTYQDAITQQQPRSLLTKPLFYAWLLLPLVALMLLALLFFFSRHPRPIEIYNANLKRITRWHSRRMIELTEIPETAGQTDIRLKNIRSLIRLSAHLRKPLCYISNSARLPEDGRIYLLDTYYRYYYQEAARDYTRIKPRALQKLPSHNNAAHGVAQDIPPRAAAQDIPPRGAAQAISSRATAQDIPSRATAQDIPSRTAAQDILSCAETDMTKQA